MRVRTYMCVNRDRHTHAHGCTVRSTLLDHSFPFQWWMGTSWIVTWRSLRHGAWDENSAGMNDLHWGTYKSLTFDSKDAQHLPYNWKERLHNTIPEEQGTERPRQACGLSLSPRSRLGLSSDQPADLRRRRLSLQGRHPRGTAQGPRSTFAGPIRARGSVSIGKTPRSTPSKHALANFPSLSAHLLLST